MTVAELIAKLSELPDDSPVRVFYGSSISDIERVEPTDIGCNDIAIVAKHFEYFGEP